MNRSISYAQNREDIIIDGFFEAKERGFYVDVGANHPTVESVTRRFYVRGWHGINIEPNTDLHRLLVAARPRDLNLCVGVGAVNGEAVFRQYPQGDGLSTFAAHQKDSQNPYYAAFKEEYVDIRTPIKNLATIASEHLNGVTVDFLKIDVEGYEYDALQGVDWSLLSPELICIEANHNDKDWRPILKKNGYVKFFFDGLNEYYALESSARLKAFEFPESVLMKLGQVTPFAAHFDQSEATLKVLIQANMEGTAPPLLAPRFRIRNFMLNLRIAAEDLLVESIMRERRVILSRALGQIPGDKGAIDIATLQKYMRRIRVRDTFKGVVKRVLLKLIYLGASLNSRRARHVSKG